MAQQILDLFDDLIILYKGDCLPVAAGPGLRSTGWHGGVFVQFVPPTGVDDFVVEKTDGTNIAGLLMFASESYGGGGDIDGSPHNYTGQQMRTEQGAVAGASTVTLMSGNCRLFFKYYETEALTGAGVREGGPITYELNKTLYVSENGLLCNDSPANLLAAGVEAQSVGICSAIPGERNNNRLGLDMRM